MPEIRPGVHVTYRDEDPDPGQSPEKGDGVFKSVLRALVALVAASLVSSVVNVIGHLIDDGSFYRDWLPIAAEPWLVLLAIYGLLDRWRSGFVITVCLVYVTIGLGWIYVAAVVQPIGWTPWAEAVLGATYVLTSSLTARGLLKSE